MRSSKWRVVKPDSTAGLVALELRVACRHELDSDVDDQLVKLTIIEICQDSCDKDGNALAINPSPGLKVNTEVLFWDS